MISTLLLCKQDQERSYKRVGGRTRERKSVGGRLTVVTIALSFLALTIMIRFSEADERLESQVGKPCICNSTFYRHCPPEGNCLEDLVLDPKSDDSGAEDFSPDHDDMDPDHVDIDPLFDGGTSYYRGDEPVSSISGMTPVLTHRKVYLTPRNDDWKPTIHKFRITIPVSVPTYGPAHIPPPKPVFKYRKYTTYENKQEVQMVPITKTIIKPVGVSRDQIINDDSLRINGRNYLQ